eukprot:CFRG7269T1
MVSEYPGTSYARLKAIHARVAHVALTGGFSQDWVRVTRLRLLWAGGMKNLSGVAVGWGYNGHSFNDFNHCDLTAMKLNVADNRHDGSVSGISRGNALGEGIRIASVSLHDMGIEDSKDYGEVEGDESGSWSTCMMGCNMIPPNDVAHTQFRSRIAFKLVWCPPDFNTFILVDDEGNLLATGNPTGRLPPLQERTVNYDLVKESKYAVVADSMAGGSPNNDKTEL